LIKSFFLFLGINKEIIYTSSNSIIGAIGSVVTSLLIINFLSINEQGFYYTFGSIIAVQVFFELGLNGILIQFVAHEVSHLNRKYDGTLQGELRYKSRLSSLLHFSVKWYCFFSTLLFFSLVFIGFFFFRKYSISISNVSWLIPWRVLVMGSAVNLLISPITAFLQGLGRVKDIAKFQLLVQIIRLIIIWFGLLIGTKLMVLGLSNLLSALLLVLLITLKFKNEIIDIWETKISEKISYLNEIFPLQWKIGLSWISGYLISQLFNPVLFATEGPAVAGKMGLTLSALNGIMAISLAWFTTKIPTFSGLIAMKKFDELDSIFNKTLWQSAIVNFLLVALFVFVVFLLNTYSITINSKLIGNRFLDYLPLVFMSLPITINHIVASWAIYLRCHKEEPYLIFSIVGGIACVFFIIFFGSKYGLLGLTFGYFSIILLMFPWAYIIFNSKKNEWHSH
jgi:O-antigen/teichoic acid export membrane protein